MRSDDVLDELAIARAEAQLNLITSIIKEIERM